MAEAADSSSLNISFKTRSYDSKEKPVKGKFGSRLLVALLWAKHPTPVVAPYLIFGPSISQEDLDLICELANQYLEQTDALVRLGNSMGEIIPYYV